ncbi:MAG: response regulator [Elusimicrobia bacterium]|nr:response regulator [Elusimicrobiota bacterium]MBI2915345.1 response regulator [Elusimicrobiota bacterium]MBI3012951.1 response regulator [Elusimicrobiota bacterium]MBI4218272.1 response regulator [Elusimicrobiota bacterium]
MPRVMVVDDENDVVELIKFMLEKDGNQVISASNGLEALEKVEVVKPDLIILDIMMPEMDGYTVNNRLMEKEETRTIPVIILTAKGQMRDLFELGTNVVAFLEKPFDPRGLRDKVRELLNKH